MSIDKPTKIETILKEIACYGVSVHTTNPGYGNTQYVFTRDHGNVRLVEVSGYKNALAWAKAYRAGYQHAFNACW